MVIKNVSLDIVCGITSKLPDTGSPEIAFAGKSNVGKSSLINGLLNRKALARTSSQPGKTQTINFYNVEDLLYFVDLPGYGYAKASHSEIEKWGKIIEDYLTKRESLKAIIMLVDIRHEPGANDLMMYDWLKHYNHKIIIVATKSDKLKRSQLQKHVAMLKKGFNLQKEDIILPFSSETKSGRDELWEIIEGICEIEKEEK